MLLSVKEASVWRRLSRLDALDLISLALLVRKKMAPIIFHCSESKFKDKAGRRHNFSQTVSQPSIFKLRSIKTSDTRLKNSKMAGHVCLSDSFTLF